MRVEGVDRLKRELAAYEIAKQSGVTKALNMTGLDIQRRATKLSPVNKKIGKGGGILKNANFVEFASNGKQILSVGNSVEYAAYQEFGTGSNVKVPKGYEAVASKHKGSGGRNPNLEPQPFLIPAIELSKEKLTERIKKLFK